MILQVCLETYVEGRDIEASTRFGYEEAVRSFGTFLGRTATVADLSPETINRWLQWFKDRGRSPYTIANRRRHLMVLARFCSERGWVGSLDERRIRSIKLPPTPKRIWKPEEVAKLIAACDLIEDRRMVPLGVRRQAWWRSLILAAWDTGLRWSDLKRLTKWDIQEDGTIDLVQHKTSVEHRVRLSRAAFAALDESFAGLPGDRDLCWPCESETWRHKDFREIATKAGLRGTFGQLRRSSIVAVERQQIGAGMIHAGHTKLDTTHRYYIPRREMMDLAPQPPEIGAVQEANQVAKPRRLVRRIKPGQAETIVSPSGEQARIKFERDASGSWCVVVESPGGDWQLAKRPQRSA